MVSYSTYLGGSGSDAVFDVAVDNAGNMYVVGTTDSSDFFTIKGGSDAFVAKYNATGTLVNRFVFGDSGDDAGFSIAVDDAGNVYVTGSTDSTDLPVINASHPKFGGGAQDAFVLKLTPSFSLIYATYLGGKGSDSGFGITADKAGNAYVTGSTDSSDPSEYAAFSGSNVFVAKFNGIGTRESLLVFGGNGEDTGFDIAVDTGGYVYITGVTNSDDFVTKSDASSPVANGKIAQVGFGGVQDAFVTKLNPLKPNESNTIYSTYIGGTGSDVGFGIAVDATGSAYVTGATESSEFSTLGGRNVFVQKLNPSGSDRVYFAVIGGSGDDTGFGIAVDKAGNAYVTGSTDSSNFNTARAMQPALKGAQDAFIAKLNATGSSLTYASYFGGTGNDAGFSVTVDENQRAYIAGFSGSDDLQSVGAAQAQNGGGGDAFVARVTDTVKKQRTFGRRVRSSGN